MTNKLLTIILIAALSHAQPVKAEDEGLLRVPIGGSFGVSEPTAMASALGTHLTGSVDYSTGRATFSAVLCCLEGGDGLSLTVRLRHVTGGLKPEQEEGPAGIGWELSCGGFISRVIVGRPDEEATYNFRSSQHTSVDSLRQYVDGNKDNGADRYTFRAGEATGDFIIDRQGRVVLMPASDV